MFTNRIKCIMHSLTHVCKVLKFILKLHHELYFDFILNERFVLLMFHTDIQSLQSHFNRAR